MLRKHGNCIECTSLLLGIENLIDVVVDPSSVRRKSSEHGGEGSGTADHTEARETGQSVNAVLFANERTARISLADSLAVPGEETGAKHFLVEARITHLRIPLSADFAGGNKI